MTLDVNFLHLNHLFSTIQLLSGASVKVGNLVGSYLFIFLWGFQLMCVYGVCSANFCLYSFPSITISSWGRNNLEPILSAWLCNSCMWALPVQHNPACEKKFRRWLKQIYLSNQCFEEKIPAWSGALTMMKWRRSNHDEMNFLWLSKLLWLFCAIIKNIILGGKSI